LLHLYIYWRVAEADATAAEQAVVAWQRQLCAAEPGLRAELLRRADAERPGLVTLMECYRGPSDTRAAELTEGAPLDRWLQGVRHVERFVPVLTAS
jgi:hypothetical protein